MRQYSCIVVIYNDEAKRLETRNYIAIKQVSSFKKVCLISAPDKQRICVKYAI